MLLIMPVMSVLAIYVLAAIFPAVLLMRYIYQKDTVEKEPPQLLISLLFRGIAAALAAIVLEALIQSALPRLLNTETPGYVIVTAFVGIAAIEEGSKLFFLKRRTWRDPNFNYRFDGVVYAVFVSLGFAAFENLEYVFHYGLAVAAPRALLLIPGHMGFAVFMGSFYGRAKLCESRGNFVGQTGNLWAGYLSAVFLHGFYDSCAMIGNGYATLLFVGFVVIMYIAVIRRVKRESLTDTPV